MKINYKMIIAREWLIFISCFIPFFGFIIFRNMYRPNLFEDIFSQGSRSLAFWFLVMLPYILFQMIRSTYYSIKILIYRATVDQGDESITLPREQLTWVTTRLDLISQSANIALIRLPHMCGGKKSKTDEELVIDSLKEIDIISEQARQRLIGLL